MTARILVVDDILANVKLLEARLQAEYFEVLTAYSGAEALEICTRERVDVVLLDVMMPGMDGFEVCRRLKVDPHTQDIPVIMVTALDQPSDKLQGLEAGADDFLTKPVDEIALITRVKNLVRLKMLDDEMALRAATSDQMSLERGVAIVRAREIKYGRLLLVDDNPRSASRILDTISKLHDAFLECDTAKALAKINSFNFDLVVVSLGLTDADGLRLCSQIRSTERTRHLPIIILVDPGDETRLLRGLDMGVNDYVIRPVDRHELLARVRTQIRRKRHSDFLRHRLEESVEMAVTDPLTGLHNRRYMETHLNGLMHEARNDGRALSIMITDIDHFKRINDTHGHDAGDSVLRDFAARLRRHTRGIDLACRFGGEEFIVIMPDTELDVAHHVGERLRECIAEAPFVINSQTTIEVTASVGLATMMGAGDTTEALFKRADNALYAAKRAGRNRVMSDAA
ncbi:MAG: PleD family two-component system response regulator [Alphaproteobacteria bacterium]|nr:PleD family two-component system response regulator [Alphaproteobacteria bacterium]